MNITILTAVHKDYRIPEDSMYLPVFVGAAGREEALVLTRMTEDRKELPCPCARDDSGDNISAKNPNYCELTALYWAWKQMTGGHAEDQPEAAAGGYPAEMSRRQTGEMPQDNPVREADYIGLVHYRRHFTVPGRRGGSDKWQRVLTKKQLEGRLRDCDVILPKPRNYFIETGYSHYAHAHHAADLDVTRQILEERYPAYAAAFDKVLARTWGHRFNMFVMKRELSAAYCSWLFDVLFELEKRLDISDYSSNDARVFGFVGERLLDVWIETNEIPYMNLPFLFMEPQNWLVKGGNFLRRKFLGKKE